MTPNETVKTDAASPAGAPGQDLAQLDAAVRQTASFGNELAQDPQLLADFFVEARDHLAQIEMRLLELEQGSSNAETMNSLFRSFHTLKGLAGFLDFAGIQQVAHDVENLLDEARNGRLTLDEAGFDAVLLGRDIVEAWLKYLEGAATAPPDSTDLTNRLHRIMNREAASPPAAEEAAVVPAAEPAASPAPAAPQAAEPVSAKPAAPAAPPPAAPPDAPRAAAPVPAATETSLVKVHTNKLEYLVDMVGELVIAQAMLRHDPALAAVTGGRVQRNLAQLARVTGEVQKTAMAMRMVPIGQLFRRMTRLVRDLARKSGKQAELEMSGEEVELDRSIVEELGDPLVHMIRNSLDHGLEMPDERLAAGKPATGRILLKAWHQSGQILVEVSDDGRGLNRDKILAKARQRNLISEGETLNDNDVFDLIFRPGFSTADQVTEVSGRGVGMDVVRRQIEKLRGRVEVTSEPGQGTRFLLKVPLTLAIIEGLVVMVGQERFILPISSVREMLRPSSENLFTIQGRHEMVLVRGNLLPVLRLYRTFQIQPRSEDPCQSLLVVLEGKKGAFCLLVDEMAGKQEVVIKSLGPVFQHIPGLAGGAILGDGRVGLILEIQALGGMA